MKSPAVRLYCPKRVSWGLVWVVLPAVSWGLHLLFPEWLEREWRNPFIVDFYVPLGGASVLFLGLWLAWDLFAPALYLKEKEILWRRGRSFLLVRQPVSEILLLHSLEGGIPSKPRWPYYLTWQMEQQAQAGSQPLTRVVLNQRSAEQLVAYFLRRGIQVESSLLRCFQKTGDG